MNDEYPKLFLPLVRNSLVRSIRIRIPYFPREADRKRRDFPGSHVWRNLYGDVAHVFCDAKNALCALGLVSISDFLTMASRPFSLNMSQVKTIYWL